MRRLLTICPVSLIGPVALRKFQKAEGMLCPVVGSK